MHKPSIEHLKKHFWVIGVISNPCRYQSRYRLFFDWEKQMKAAGVNLIVAEEAFGDRDFVVTKPDNPYHLRVRSFDELWRKENLQNLSSRLLPDDFMYVAAIDCDITFLRPDWVEETINQLQHYHIVQMFQNCIDMGPTGETIKVNNGFVWSYLDGRKWGKEYSFWHPGFAWAYDRYAWESLGSGGMDGPMISGAVLGAADHHQALALIQKAELSLPSGVHPHYRDMVMTWQDRATRFIRRDIGFVPGSITHHFHGALKNRRYVERWDIITKNQFTPYHDLVRDYQGLFQIDLDRIQLRDDIRRYFRQRNEDSIDLV